MFLRQAHPGPGARPYRDHGQKVADARRYAREESIPWSVLVDDLDGTVHQVYGGLADPTYLIDADGRVAFYCMWTHGPSLYRAIQALLRQECRGVVRGGVDRVPHVAHAITDGWRALERGRPQSVTDLLVASPPLPPLLWLGSKLRPVLRPLTQRARPLPAGALALGLGALLVVGLGLGWRASQRSAPARRLARAA